MREDDSTSTVSNLEFPTENTSGQGSSAQVPSEIMKWNWGAFLLNWIWGIGNNTYIALLALIPFVGLVMPFILGAKGNEWAWKNKRWKSLDDFKYAQSSWAIVGAIVAVGLVLVVFISAIFTAIAIPVYNTARRKAATYEKQKSGLDSATETYYKSEIRRVQQVLKTNPKDHHSLVETGNLYFDWAMALRKTKDYKSTSAKFRKAISYYERALELKPKDGDVRTDLAIAYFYSGDTDRAIIEVRKVIADNPTHAVAYYNLGVFYQSKGEKAEAIQAWEKYIELAPDGEQAEFVKKELEELKKGQRRH